MPLTPGSRLGPYEILGPIGAGGMGEVYRARDPRLGRDVAVKVLPASFAADADRLRRFEQESRAAGLLNHPNVTAVYDVGADESGAPYVVSELLEGETLRAALAGGKLSPRRAIDYALQIAHGLSAAHEKGIVHRDLKPENVFVTKDGRVKILDFGLAKLLAPSGSGPATSIPTATAGTEPGVVLGTLGYMSPEQVRGREADARSDIFSFGAILYEMLAGKRAFAGDSAADTMSAILKEDPPDLSVTNANVSPGLDRVVRHCLEKAPERRFQSAHDLAFDLEALSGISDPRAAAAAAARAKTRRVPAVAWLLAAAAAGIALGHFLWTSPKSPAPTFRRLTFRRGNIGTARFAPDGQTIVYSAAWESSPISIYSGRLDRPESLPLGFAKADLVGVSSTSELALSLHDSMSPRDVGLTGTLARATIGGGAPREVLEFVNRADWTPDGRDFAIVRSVGGRERIECPIGKVIYTSPTSQILSVRVSPDGNRIAFLEGARRAATICVVDREGHRSILTEPYAVQRMAWSPDGREIWYSVLGPSGEGRIESVDLAGKKRTRFRAPAGLILHDIAPDGRLLVERYIGANGVLALVPGASAERQLSWFDSSMAVDLSPDGSLLLMSERGEAAAGRPVIYLRKTDGSPAVRLGDGAPFAFFPDCKSVLVRAGSDHAAALQRIPTGTGSPVEIPLAPFAAVGIAWPHPDGKRIVLAAALPGQARRFWVRDIPNGAPRAISPDGFDSTGQPISADGKWIVGFRDWNENLWLFPIDGGAGREIPDSLKLDPIRWASDGTLFVAETGTIPHRVHRLDVATGKRTLVRELAPSEAENAIGIDTPAMTPDGRFYVYSYSRVATSDLFLVEGLR